MTRRGFTLIELLVVISIIALLIALMLPSLRQAREQAVLVKCGSNLRQMGVACVSYASDHKGRFPWGWNQLNSTSIPDNNYYLADATEPVFAPGGAAALLGEKGYVPRGSYVGGAYINNPVLDCPALATRAPLVPETPGFVYYNYWRVSMYNGGGDDGAGAAAGPGLASYGYVGYLGDSGNPDPPHYRAFRSSYYNGNLNVLQAVSFTTIADGTEQSFFNWNDSDPWLMRGLTLDNPPGNPTLGSCPFVQPYYTWSMGINPHFGQWTAIGTSQWDLVYRGDTAGRRNYVFRDGSARTRSRHTVMP